MIEKVAEYLIGVSVIVFLVTGAFLLFQLKRHQHEWWIKTEPPVKKPWLIRGLWKLGALADQTQSRELIRSPVAVIRTLTRIYLVAAYSLFVSGILVFLFQWVL